MDESASPLTWEAVPGIHLLPVVHERLDLAAVVVEVLDQLDAGGVAVELPRTLGSAVATAVARLPEISVVLSEPDAEASSGSAAESSEDALAWVVAPGDPLAEGLRWAREHRRRSFLIDPDVRYAERHRDLVPDPYALWTLGPGTYLQSLVAALGQAPASEADLLREAGMAHHLQEARAALDAADEPRPLVALLGAAHVTRVAARLGGPTAPPLARQRRERVQVVNLHPESLSGLLTDPPLAHAAYEHLRGDLPDGEPLPVTFEETLSRKVSLVRHGLRLLTGEKDDERRRRLAALPAYVARETRGSLPGSAAERSALDRHRLPAVLWRIAEGSYREQTQETLAPWQRRAFFDYLRRYTRVQGRLVAGLYEWVVAARGVADDNFAWEVFDAARTYPWQRDQAEIETAKLDGEVLDLGTRQVRFRRRFFRVKQRPVRVPVRERPTSEDPEDWLRGFDSAGICSYPKEDLVVEDYGHYLQKKAVAILTAENRRTEPFSTSLLDGIDVRETLRNLHQDRIFVQELGRAPGDAGSVVVIFDRDSVPSETYPYLMTWHGEHDQESDMAFYATDPSEQVVGPGITRATYGGFLMSYPPGRLGDIWDDPDYRMAREKAEVLTLAAVDYCEERLVVHVAADPPGERLKSYAVAQGKRLVHLPLGSLSPGTVRKVRVVHLLAGRDKRKVADRYIW